MTETEIQAYAAYLADPAAGSLEMPTEIPVTGESASELLHILRQNKVSLLAIPEESALGTLDDFCVARRAEQERLDALRSEYLEVQSLWRQAGIRDVIIKSGGAYPSFPYLSGNLDVLVAADDGPQARAILRGAGYVEMRNVEENAKYLFRRFHLGREVSGIHLHEHVGWFSSFLDETHVLDASHPAPDDEALLVPCAEDILLTTLAHAFYEDKEIKLGDLAAMQHCARQPGLDWDLVFQVAQRRGWRDGLGAALLICAHLGRLQFGRTPIPEDVLDCAAEAISSSQRRKLNSYLEPGLGYLRPSGQGPLSLPLSKSVWRGVGVSSFAVVRHEWPVRIPFTLSKRYFYGRLWHDPVKPLPRRLADLAIHTLQGIKLRLHIGSQPALLVALSGIDGSGKTSLADTLCAAFDGCHIRATRVWSRPGSSPLLAWAWRLVRGRKAVPTGGQHADMDDIARRKTLFRRRHLRTAWQWLTALELIATYTWRVRTQLWRGRVVVCDRYVLDALVEWGSYFGVGAGIWRSLPARLLRWLAPRPRLNYLLDASPGAAKGRAVGAPAVSFMQEQAELYRALASRFGAAIADARRPLPELADEMSYQVLTRYFDGYRTWVNAIFFRNPRPMPATYQEPAAGRA